MEVVLYEPEIPPNTGNAARLCAAMGVPLHLVEPLGFSLSDKHLKRAGLDYWPHVDLSVWESWAAFTAARPDLRLVCTSARRGRPVRDFAFQPGDGLVFGPETRGLPDGILDQAGEKVVTIPMAQSAVRSINLATAAGIVLYEALRTAGKPGRPAGP